MNRIILLFLLFMCIGFQVNAEYRTNKEVAEKLALIWEVSHEGQEYIFHSELDGLHAMMHLERFTEHEGGTFVGRGFSFKFYVETNNGHHESNLESANFALYGVCDLTGYCGTGESGSERPVIITRLDSSIMEIDLSNLVLNNFNIPSNERKNLRSCYKLKAWNGSKSNFSPKCVTYLPFTSP